MSAGEKAGVILDAALTVIDRATEGLGLGGGFLLIAACFMGGGFCFGVYVVNKAHEVTCGRWSR